MTKHIYNLNYYDCEVGIVRDFTLSSDMTKKKVYVKCKSYIIS